MPVQHHLLVPTLFARCGVTLFSESAGGAGDITVVLSELNEFDPHLEKHFFDVAAKVCRTYLPKVPGHSIVWVYRKCISGAPDQFFHVSFTENRDQITSWMLISHDDLAQLVNRASVNSGQGFVRKVSFPDFKGIAIPFRPPPHGERRYAALR